MQSKRRDFLNASVASLCPAMAAGMVSADDTNHDTSGDQISTVAEFIDV